MHADTASSGDEDAVELAIFDIDGPVTQPESRRIEQSEILELMLDFVLDRGYIAYNTGRASIVAHNRVVSPLLSRAIARGVSTETVSARISIFAEKGGVTSVWDGGLGEWTHRIDHATVVPPDLRTAVTDLLQSDHEFRTYIFHDNDKETMVSVEMRHQTSESTPVPVTMDIFKPIAERFAAEVRQLAEDRGYDDLQVDRTTIAVDIQCRGVGKDLGARLAFDWLAGLGKRVSRVHCFGDSQSDVAMAVAAHSVMSHWFADAGERVVYVHVGDALPIDGDFAMKIFPNMYGLGTVAYLRDLS
jgi:hypothetical protein